MCDPSNAERTTIKTTQATNPKPAEESKPNAGASTALYYIPQPGPFRVLRSNTTGSGMPEQLCLAAPQSPASTSLPPSLQTTSHNSDQEPSMTSPKAKSKKKRTPLEGSEAPFLGRQGVRKDSYGGDPSLAGSSSDEADPRHGSLLKRKSSHKDAHSW